MNIVSACDFWCYHHNLKGTSYDDKFSGISPNEIVHYFALIEVEVSE